MVQIRLFQTQEPGQFFVGRRKTVDDGADFASKLNEGRLTFVAGDIDLDWPGILLENDPSNRPGQGDVAAIRQHKGGGNDRMTGKMDFA